MRRFVVEVKKQNCTCEKAMKRAIKKKKLLFFWTFCPPKRQKDLLVISMKISPSTKTGTSYPKDFLQPYMMKFVYTTFILPHTWYTNNKVNWIVTMKAKNTNKWTKPTMKTEGYMANQLHLCNYYIGTGHCPSTGHPYIKATHHEWNNSREERFPLWLPRTTLCVWMCCSDHYSKGDSHATRIDLTLWWIFQYRELRIMPV